MTCPDEATFLRLQNGTLPSEAVLALHAHLDICPRCLELASLLDDANGTDLKPPSDPVSPRPGDTFAPSALTPTPSGPQDRDRKLVLVAQLFLGLSHLAWWFLAARLTAWDPSPTPPVHPKLVSALSLYSTYWGPMGSLLVFLGGWLSLRRKRLGANLAALHAGLSLPTVVLAPLACTVLFGLWRIRLSHNRSSANIRATVGYRPAPR